jgi:hypothetical protein
MSGRAKVTAGRENGHQAWLSNPTPDDRAALELGMSFLADVTACRENGRRHRPRGYADWRPQRKTRILLGQVAEILEEYADHLPLTVRQIFYRLVAPYLYPKTENAYERLCEHLVRARRARLIPFDYIRDDGVVTVSHTTYGGIEDFDDETARRARAYRRDRQAGQPHYVELWCEAAGMLHQLDRVASEFSVPVFTNGRQTSLSGVRQIVDRALERTVPTVLLQVGDCDPTGHSIYEAMVEDAAAFVEAERQLATQRIVPVRVALTADQIADHDLPTAPPKKTDSRSKKWKGPTCQLEALAPDVLAEIVKRAIVDQLDLDRFERALEQERADRAELLALPPGEGS